MQVSTYENLKSSGSTWLGDIPTHWDTKKLKFTTATFTGFAFSSDDYVPEGVPLIRISDVLSNGFVDVENAKRLPLDYIHTFRELVIEKNAILMAMTGATIGKSAKYLHDGLGLLNQRVCKFLPRTLNADFLWHVLNSEPYSEYIKITCFGGAQPNISDKELLEFCASFPPIEEQQAIARFLDFKTAQIDALISKKKELLDKLAEKRTALISHAVTKGLDPSVAMKDSGVAWLGNIPAHWRIKRLKFSTDLINDKVNVEDSPLSYLGLEHIESWTGRKIDGEISNSEGLASSFFAGDVLFGKLRPYLAKVHLAQQDGLISSEALVIRSKEELHSEFLKYYMLSRDFINIVDSSTYGSKMPRASWDFIGNLPVLLPSVDEQINIIAYLSKNLKKTDAQKEKIDFVIDRLQEYRSALITNAVTGKIDVRGFEISQPAELQEPTYA